MTQKETLEKLRSGANCFVTGSPGAGKTYVITSYASKSKGKT